MTTYVVGSGVTSTGLNLLESTDFIDVLNGGRAVSTLLDGLVFLGSNDVGLDQATMFVEAGGVASLTTLVGSLSLLHVSSGGFGFLTNVSSGGIEAIEGFEEDTKVHSGGTVRALSGGVAASAVIEAGGFLAALAGGVLENTFFGSSGTVNISSGGVSSNSHIDQLGADELISVGGLSVSALVADGAFQEIFSGGVTRGTHATTLFTSEAGGIQVVHAGGVASNSFVDSGGRQVVSGTASGTIVGIFGSVAIEGGLTVGATVSNGGEITVFTGTASGTILSLGGLQVISSGGIARLTRIVDGGVQGIASGGIASTSLISSGGIEEVESGGIATGTIVRSGGAQQVFSGGLASATIVSAGGSLQVSSGRELGAVISSGGSELVLAGGLASVTTVSVGGLQVVENGGAAVATNVLVGGSQTVSSGGVASFTTVSGGGTETVASGGVATLTTVLAGARQQVLSSGLAAQTRVESGGRLVVSAGGSANTTTITSGGTLELDGTGSAATFRILSGGIFAIASSHLEKAFNAGSGITFAISNGGRADFAIIQAGGTETVSSGGLAEVTSVLSGGNENVSAGGRTFGTRVSSGGSQTISSGGTASGTIVLAGGQQIVSATGLASATTIGSGGLLDVESAGAARSTTISGGGEEFIAVFGVDSGATIAVGGDQAVFGSAVNAVLAGGEQDDHTLAISTIVSSGGQQFVDATGVASGTVVSNGGVEVVLSAGVTISTTVLTGGSEVVSSGGRASATVLSGGTITVLPGGTTGSVTIGTNAVLELGSTTNLIGYVNFVGSGGTLLLDDSTVPNNTISGFAPGDTIDLASIPFDRNGTATLGADNKLQIVENGGTTTLTFDPMQNFGRDVFELSADSGGGTLVTVEGPFQPAQLVLSNFALSAGGWSSQDLYPRVLGDVNGDGSSDIVGFGQDGVWVSLANADGTFTTPKLVLSNFAVSAGGWSSQDLYPRTVGDVDGDGSADIVGFGKDGVWVALANGSGGFSSASLVLSSFGVSAGGWSSDDTYPRELGDVNGDGKADIVGFGQDGVWESLATSSGGFASPSLVLSNFGVSAGGWSDQNTYPRELGDVNGDGRDDIVGFGQDGVWVSLANSDGTFTTPKLVLSNFAVSAGGWTSQDQYPRLLADVNGDARADIVAFGQEGVWTSLSNGDGTFAAATFDFNDLGFSTSAGGWTSQDTFPRSAADITGGGSADLVGFGFSGVFVALATDHLQR